MESVKKISDCLNLLEIPRKNNQSVGFVPTMGALHDGHISLVERSKSENDLTVMSIYVNPTQFGPKEDFATYPRPFEKDAELARKSGVDLLFHPSTDEIYPKGFTTYVEETELS